MLAAFFEAQHVNLHSGGAVIAPWELLPGFTLSDWVEAALQLSKVPNLRARIKAQNDFLERERRKHKDYAVHHYRKSLLN